MFLHVLRKYLLLQRYKLNELFINHFIAMLHNPHHVLFLRPIFTTVLHSSAKSKMRTSSVVLSLRPTHYITILSAISPKCFSSTVQAKGVGVLGYSLLKPSRNVLANQFGPRHSMALMLMAINYNLHFWALDTFPDQRNYIALQKAGRHYLHRLMENGVESGKNLFGQQRSLPTGKDLGGGHIDLLIKASVGLDGLHLELWGRCRSTIDEPSPGPDNRYGLSLRKELGVRHGISPL